MFVAINLSGSRSDDRLSFDVLDNLSCRRVPRSILEDDVEGVDDAWEVTKNGQKDVDPEVTIVCGFIMLEDETKATKDAGNVKVSQYDRCVDEEQARQHGSP